MNIFALIASMKLPARSYASIIGRRAHSSAGSHPSTKAHSPAATASVANKDRGPYRATAAGQLEHRIGAQKIQIVSVLVAARNGEDAGADHSASVRVIRAGSRRSRKQRANRSATPRRRSAIDSNMTPPSEVRRPPSKSAVTFLRATDGNENGRAVSSSWRASLDVVREGLA